MFSGFYDIQIELEQSKVGKKKKVNMYQEINTTRFLALPLKKKEPKNIRKPSLPLLIVYLSGLSSQKLQKKNVACTSQRI